MATVALGVAWAEGTAGKWVAFHLMMCGGGRLGAEATTETTRSRGRADALGHTARAACHTLPPLLRLAIPPSLPWEPGPGRGIGVWAAPDRRGGWRAT